MLYDWTLKSPPQSWGTWECALHSGSWTHNQLHLILGELCRCFPPFLWHMKCHCKFADQSIHIGWGGVSPFGWSFPSLSFFIILLHFFHPYGVCPLHCHNALCWSHSWSLVSRWLHYLFPKCTKGSSWDWWLLCIQIGDLGVQSSMLPTWHFSLLPQFLTSYINVMVVKGPSSHSQNCDPEALESLCLLPSPCTFFCNDSFPILHVGIFFCISNYFKLLQLLGVMPPCEILVDPYWVPF